MARKNRGICGLLGPSWVLISMPPRNSKHHSSILAANASVRYKEAELRELPQAITCNTTVVNSQPINTWRLLVSHFTAHSQSYLLYFGH